MKKTKQPTRKEKKPYQTPRLKTYGELARVTGTITKPGSKADSPLTKQ